MKKKQQKKVPESHIYLTGDVNEELAVKFFDFYTKIDSPTDLVVHICSPGGDVDIGFAIHDMLRSWPWHVTTVGYGVVGSMAVTIFAAGTERLMAPNTNVLIHPVSSKIDGTIKEISAYTEAVVRSHKNMVKAIAERTTDPEFIASAAEKETFITPQKAMEIGLVTGIIGFTN